MDHCMRFRHVQHTWATIWASEREGPFRKNDDSCRWRRWRRRFITNTNLHPKHKRSYAVFSCAASSNKTSNCDPPRHIVTPTQNAPLVQRSCMCISGWRHYWMIFWTNDPTELVEAIWARAVALLHIYTLVYYGWCNWPLQLVMHCIIDACSRVHPLLMSKPRSMFIRCWHLPEFFYAGLCSSVLLPDVSRLEKIHPASLRKEKFVFDQHEASWHLPRSRLNFPSTTGHRSSDSITIPSHFQLLQTRFGLLRLESDQEGFVQLFFDSLWSSIIE